MSVIQKIRDKYAGVVIAFIALSLIAFILMDAFSGRGGGGFGNNSTIGRVNGTKIEKRDFDKQVDLYKKYYGRGGGSESQYISAVWDMSVDRITMQDEYEKLGLTFSTKELNALLFGNNPPYWVKQFFTDPNTGVYDQQRLIETIKNIKTKKNDPEVSEFYEVYIQQQTIEQSLRQKYSALLSNSVYVPKWLAEKQMADNNAISSISYVYVPYASIADSTIKVSDDDIKSYVKNHEKQFSVEEETRTVSYVSFDMTPSAADSQNARNQVMQLRNEFASTTDVASFLNRVQTDFPYDSTYHSAKSIQHSFKDSIIAAGVGNVYGPYQDGKEVVLARLMSTKVLPDSAKVRHILIKTQDPRSGQTFRDDSTAKKLADSLQGAIARGANFDSLVLKFSEDEGSANLEKKGVYDWFPQGAMVPEFNSFSFEKSVGSKGVVKTAYGYHYIEVLGQKNPQPSYRIAYLAKAIEAGTETVDAINAEAQRFAAESRSQKKFEENLTKFKKTAAQSNEIKKNDFAVGGLGENRTFVRWIYDNDLGDVSDPIAFEDRVVVAYINNIQEKGVMNAATARKPQYMTETLVRNELKAKKIIADKFKGNSLESYAQSAGAPIQRGDSLSFASSFIPGVGLESKVIGVAFNRSQLNKVTEPIAGSNGVFGVRVELIGAKPGAGSYQDIQKTMEGQLRSNGYNAINALKKAAKVKDYRFDFF
jgi:peptidyl-prolyl cis-trans isomerase D